MSRIKASIFLLLITIPFLSRSQESNTIQGTVVHGVTGAPIPNASVFISNTSKGTITNSKGAFSLQKIPSGSYELIISSIGYNTTAYAFTSSKLPLTLQVRLEPKTEELLSVIVEPFEKDGWQKWGSFFLENFIGKTTASENCVLKNPKTLRFRFSKKLNTLTVVADEALLIENKALGYEVKYQLESFTFDFGTRALLYTGYPLITDLAEKRKKVPERWKKNREHSYKGSIMHFMRSLYMNRVQEEGFEVRRLEKTPNLEKQRVREIYRSQTRIAGTASGAGTTVVNSQSFEDSAEYYRKVMQQPNEIEKYGSTVLTADSVVSTISTEQKTLFFSNYLYITYKNAVEEKKYVDNLLEKRKQYFQRSGVNLVDETPVIIESNGNYFPPEVFFANGYWAWSEKISHLLPYEYVLQSDLK